MGLRVENEGAVVRWIFDDPESCNALGPNLLGKLERATADLAGPLTAWWEQASHEDPPHRLLEITARPAGQRGDVWMAGGHLAELAGLETPEEGARFLAAVEALLAQVEALPIPVLTTVTGRAIGGGAEVALAGDWLLMSASAQLDFRQWRIGLTTGFGGGARLATRCGQARAWGLLAESARVAGKEALSLALAHEVASDDGFAAAVAARREAFLAADPRVLAGQKELLRGADPARREAIYRRLWQAPRHRTFLASFGVRS